MDLLRYALMLNGPTRIALTFCDHFNPAMKTARKPGDITPLVRDLITEVEGATGAPVALVDTGTYLDDMIELEDIGAWV